MYKEDNMYGQVTSWGWAATLDLGNDDDDAAAHGDDGKDGNDEKDDYKDDNVYGQ